LYENVFKYYGYSPGRRDASVCFHAVLAECNTFDSIHDRYESIQIVTKLTQKEEGPHGGQSLLHWLPDDNAASAERRAEAAEPERAEETSENIRYRQNILESGMGGKTMGVKGEAQQSR
jgi:hypothetical protein